MGPGQRPGPIASGVLSAEHEVRMLTFVVRRILYSIPVLIIASVLVFFFVHATSDPLARFHVSRDPNTVTEAGLRIGVYQKPCTHVGPEHNILKCRETPL